MIVYEYKTKPTTEQIANIEEAILITQFLRNRTLALWQERKANSRFGFSELVSNTSLSDYPFAIKLNAHARQSASDRAWIAVSTLYRNIKQKKPGKKGYPKFKHDCRSVQYKSQSGWKLSEDCKRITFTDQLHIGTLKLIGNLPLNQFKNKIKLVRLIRRADGYYCQFVIDVQNNQPQEKTGKMIGLDMGINHLYTDSNGDKVDNPRFLKKSLKKIKRSQRKSSKKLKGSENRKKANRKTAKAHLKVSRQRKDLARKLARALFMSNDLIAIEDLKVSNMIKNRRLSQAIHDVGWGLLRAELERYSNIFQKKLVVVNPHNTSQICCECKQLVKKTLKERIHRCECGCVMDRDHNAAINILLRAIELINSTEGHSETCSKERKVCGQMTSSALSLNVVSQLDESETPRNSEMSKLPNGERSCYD